MRYLRAAAIVLAILGPLFYVSAIHDLDRHDQHEQKIDGLIRQNRLLAARNQDLRRRIRGITEDPRYLEKVAREGLKWIREGETVYRIPPAPRRGLPAVAGLP